MKIVIHYDEGEWPLLTENTAEHNLDDLLDTFTAAQVPTIINQTLEAFRGMCEVWNQRELAQRRQLESDAGPTPVEGK